MSRRRRRRDRDSADVLPLGFATSLITDPMTHASSTSPPEQTPDQEADAPGGLPPAEERTEEPEAIRPSEGEEVVEVSAGEEEVAEIRPAESMPPVEIPPAPAETISLASAETMRPEPDETIPTEPAETVSPPAEMIPAAEIIRPPASPPRDPLTLVEEPPVPESADAEVVPAAMGPELEPIDLDTLAPEAVAPPRDRRRGPRFNLITGTLLLSSVALFGGYLVVNLVLMPSLTRQGVEVRVPEVIGLSEREAERLLAGEDLKLSKISEQWSPDVPRGFITAQDPAAGGIVKRGRRISVIVSLGAQGTSVPVLEGVTARQAEIMLEGAGLKLGRYARAYSEQVSKDLVIATDPPGETLVEQETAVDLLVSLGPVPRTFVLPDLAGRDAQSAAQGLRDEGFSVTLREGGGKLKGGLVAGQEPPAGHRVAPRDSIVLYYHP